MCWLRSTSFPSIHLFCAIIFYDITMKTWQEGFNVFISHRAGPVVVELQVVDHTRLAGDRLVRHVAVAHDQHVMKCGCPISSLDILGVSIYVLFHSRQ